MSLIGTPQAAAAAARNTLAGRRSTIAEALAEARRGDPGIGLFALVDAARDERIFPKLRTYDGSLPLRSLYQGELADSMAEVAPYLAQPEPGSPMLEWLLADGWGRSWGVFVLAGLDFATLRRHLRKFNLVRTEDGRSLIFRFYDPRALRLFLDTAEPGNLVQFFGTVSAFLIEEPEGTALARYTLREGTLDVRRLRVATG